MKTTDTIRFALLAAAAVFTQAAFAAAGGNKVPPTPPPPPPSSGTVILTYMHPGGMDGGYTQGYGITASPSGNIYVSGWADVDNNNQWNGIVLGSADAGASWWLLDDFGLPDFACEGGVITSDPAGNLYAAYIQYGGTTNTDHWITRRSTNGGLTWSTVDEFDEGVIFSGIDYVYGITADAAGNVYVAGESYPNLKRNWTIRKGVGGTSFSTVDTFAGGTVQAVFAHPTTGAIFAAGYGDILINGRRSTAWIVRRSTNSGATWSTADAFQLQSGQTSHAAGIGADPAGNIYVVGDSGNHWVVRKSTNGGSSFNTVDDIPPTTTKDYIYYSKAYGVAASSTGDLYVFGLFNGQNYLRKSAGGTGPWTMVDQMAFHPSAIAANSAGNVFVAGGSASGLIVKKY